MAKDCFCVHFRVANRDAYSEAVVTRVVERESKRRLGVYQCDVFGEITLSRCSDCLFREEGTSNSEDAKSVDNPAEKGGAGNAGV